jgi:hypothetical protein
MTLVSREWSEPRSKTPTCALPSPSITESWTDTFEWAPQALTPSVRTRVNRSRLSRTFRDPSKTATAIPRPGPGPPPSTVRFEIAMSRPLATSTAKYDVPAGGVMTVRGPDPMSLPPSPTLTSWRRYRPGARRTVT